MKGRGREALHPLWLPLIERFRVYAEDITTSARRVCHDCADQFNVDAQWGECYTSLNYEEWETVVACLSLDAKRGSRSAEDV